MNALMTKNVSTNGVLSSALAFLAVAGWGAFAYVSWSATTNERALQIQIARLSSNQTGLSADRKGQGEELATTRTIYPSPYGTSPSRPAQSVSSESPTAAVVRAPVGPTAPSAEPATPVQHAAHAYSGPPAPPQSSDTSAEPMATNSAAVPDANRVDINTASVEDLNRLGGRFGKAIIAARPYTSTDELVSRRVLTRSTFSQIRDQITAN